MTRRKKDEQQQSEASKQWHLDRQRYCQAVLAGATFEHRRIAFPGGVSTAVRWCFNLPFEVDGRVPRQYLYPTRRSAVDVAIWYLERYIDGKFRTKEDEEKARPQGDLSDR